MEKKNLHQISLPNYNICKNTGKKNNMYEFI